MPNLSRVILITMIALLLMILWLGDCRNVAICVVLLCGALSEHCPLKSVPPNLCPLKVHLAVQVSLKCINCDTQCAV